MDCYIIFKCKGQINYVKCYVRCFFRVLELLETFPRAVIEQYYKDGCMGVFISVLLIKAMKKTKCSSILDRFDIWWLFKCCNTLQSVQHSTEICFFMLSWRDAHHIFFQ